MAAILRRASGSESKTSRAEPINAFHQSSGSCSNRPIPGLASGMGLRPIPAIEPSQRHAIAFVDVVLLSMPTTTSFDALTATKNISSARPLCLAGTPAPPNHRGHFRRCLFPTLVVWAGNCQPRLVLARLCLIALLTMLPLACPAAAQNSDQRFSGKWEAKFNNEVICTIELRTDGGISGSMEDCRIKIDNDGNLVEPDASDKPSRPTPISDVKLAGSVLSFACKDEGDAEPTRFELHLIKEGAADLQVTNAPVKIKPIHFVRTSK